MNNANTAIAVDNDNRGPAHKRKVWVVIDLMKAVKSTSETYVNFYQLTRRNIPDDNHETVRTWNLNSFLVLGMIWIQVSTQSPANPVSVFFLIHTRQLPRQYIKSDHGNTLAHPFLIRHFILRALYGLSYWMTVVKYEIRKEHMPYEFYTNYVSIIMLFVSHLVA